MVSSKDWKDQWTMTHDEWKVIQAEAKQAIFPQDCLKVFENGGLRRVLLPTLPVKCFKF